MDMRAYSSIHSGWKIASDLLSYPFVRTQNNTKLISGYISAAYSLGLFLTIALTSTLTIRLGLTLVLWLKIECAYGGHVPSGP